MGMEMIVTFHCDKCGDELETDTDVDEFSSMCMGAATRAYEEHGPYKDSWEDDFQYGWHFFYNRESGPYGGDYFTGKVLCEYCARDWYAEETGKKECGYCDDWVDESELDEVNGFCPNCCKEDDE